MLALLAVAVELELLVEASLLSDDALDDVLAALLLDDVLAALLELLDELPQPANIATAIADTADNATIFFIPFFIFLFLHLFITLKVN